MALETVRRVKITVRVEAVVEGPDGSGLNVDESYSYSFSDGTGQDQLGTVWWDRDGSLATTTTTLDLDGQQDFKGVAMTDANAVKFMLVKNESDTGNLKVGGGDFATWVNAATDKVVIGPRGLFLLVSPRDGYGITAGTGDGLLLETTATVAYKAIIGLDNT
jgi:hypothetical protein